MDSSKRTRCAQRRRRGQRGAGHRASPGRAGCRPGWPGSMAGSCSDGRNAALTKAEQREAGPTQQLGGGSRLGPLEVGSVGLSTGSGPRKVVPEPKRDQLTRRMEGLPSVPSPNPRLPPAICTSRPLGAQALRVTLGKGVCAAPARPVLLASPIPRWAGQCW